MEVHVHIIRRSREIQEYRILTDTRIGRQVYVRNERGTLKFRPTLNDLETRIQITDTAACYVEMTRGIRGFDGALKGRIAGYPHIVQARIIETNLVTGLDGYIKGRIRIRIGHNQCQGDIDSRIVYVHIPAYER